MQGKWSFHFLSVFFLTASLFLLSKSVQAEDVMIKYSWSAGIKVVVQAPNGKTVSCSNDCHLRDLNIAPGLFRLSVNLNNEAEVHRLRAYAISSKSKTGSKRLLAETDQSAMKVELNENEHLYMEAELISLDRDRGIFYGSEDYSVWYFHNLEEVQRNVNYNNAPTVWEYLNFTQNRSHPDPHHPGFCYQVYSIACHWDNLFESHSIIYDPEVGYKSADTSMQVPGGVYKSFQKGVWKFYDYDGKEIMMTAIGALHDSKRHFDFELNYTNLLQSEWEIFSLKEIYDNGLNLDLFYKDFHSNDILIERRQAGTREYLNFDGRYRYLRENVLERESRSNFLADDYLWSNQGGVLATRTSFEIGAEGVIGHPSFNLEMNYSGYLHVYLRRPDGMATLMEKKYSVMNDLVDVHFNLKNDLFDQPGKYTVEVYVVYPNQSQYYGEEGGLQIISSTLDLQSIESMQTLPRFFELGGNVYDRFSSESGLEEDELPLNFVPNTQFVDEIENVTDVNSFN